MENEKQELELNWKILRKNLPVWQEKYMGSLVKEYIILLQQDTLASEKFWALDKKLKKAKNNPGVIVKNMSRSNMELILLELLDYEVITLDDLDEFSENLKERLTMIYNRSYKKH